MADFTAPVKMRMFEEFELIASQGCPFHDRRLWPDPNASERDESRAHLCNGPHPLVVYWNTKTHNMESRYEQWRVKWCMTNRLDKTPAGFREGVRKHYLFVLFHGYKIFGGS